MPRERVFVGVSGAGGAPYAVRLLQALTAAGCDPRLCISDSGRSSTASATSRSRSGGRSCRCGTGKTMSAPGFDRTLLPPRDGGRR